MGSEQLTISGITKPGRRQMPALDDHGKEMEHVKDEQTGRLFKIVHEKRIDRIAARISFVYLLVVAAVLLWALIKTWLDQPPVLGTIFGQQYSDRFKSPLFHLVSYAAIGGSGFQGHNTDFVSARISRPCPTLISVTPVQILL
jgi:hypothetical protein